MINNRWQFDEEFLIKTIKDAKKLLKRKDVSDTIKGLMQETICQFSEFLDVINNNYVTTSTNNDINSDFYSIKKQFINKAIHDYNTIGSNIMDMIIYLSNNHTYLCCSKESYSGNSTPDQIVEQSLELYETYFPDLLPIAKSIIEYPINLINFTSKQNIGSQCFYESIFKLPFIHIENSANFPPDFIHELQHGIEGIQEYRSYRYFKELGPILMETLYIDRMVKKREANASLLYFERIEEAEAFLDYLSCYFKCLKTLRKSNFNVKNGQFVEILKEARLIYNDRLIINGMLNDDFNEYIMYLLSFLKSLEIRNKVHQDQKYGFQCLQKSLKGKTIEYINEEKLLETYEDYLQEVILKQKNSSHTKKYYK